MGYISFSGCRPLINILLLLLLIALNACSTARTYPGPKLPPESVATVKGRTLFYGIASQTIGASEVDGKPISDWSSDVEVLPGTHTLKVKCTFHNASRSESREYEFKDVEFQAGRTYQIDFKTEKGTLTVWLIDKSNGETVAEAWGIQPLFSRH